MSIFLDRALAYAARLGWSVLPLRGKVPIIPGSRGYLDATTDPEVIREWWRGYPGANVGVSCVASGIIALDVDPRNDGDRTLAELEERHQRLPHTPRQSTGGGGEHILFRKPEIDRVRASAGRGLDVKLHGHLVVDPSITRRPYRWVKGHHPLRTPLAELPDWLTGISHSACAPPPPRSGSARSHIEEEAGWGPKPRYSRAALQRACEAVESAPWGQQEPLSCAKPSASARLIGAGLMPRRLAIDCLIYSGTTMANQPGRRRWREREITRRSPAPSAPVNSTRARWRHDDELEELGSQKEITANTGKELVEKAATEPGAPFTPDALKFLAALKKEDRAAFETLRAQLKDAGVRVGELDEAIRPPRAASDNGNGNEMSWPETEPWPDPVNGADLLDDITKLLLRFLVMPTGAAEAVALWVTLTHCHDAAEHSPVLAVTSPVKRCGKSTLLELLLGLVFKALSTSNTSVAALFRGIEMWQPTVLIDEGDTFLRDNEELRGIINSGHRRGSAYVDSYGG